MKNISVIVFTCLFALLLTSCKKNLDPKIYGQLTPGNFPQTESDYLSYTLEVYKPFQAKWGYNTATGYQNLFYGYEYSDVQINEAPTDEIAPFTEWGGFFEFFSKANFNFLITQDRSSHFEKVRFVSLITKTIGDLEQANISEATKNELLGEAHMARGFLMYHLLTMYGPVPVILDPTQIGTSAEYNLVRPSEADYTAAVAADLQFAADNLPRDAEQYGRFNKGLALTVLMRLQLFEKNYQQAEDTGRQLLTLGYTLVPDYMSLFKSATEKNNETIYAVSVDPSSNGNDNQGNMNAWPYYCYPTGFPGTSTQLKGGGWAWPAGPYTATWQFYDMFDSNDTRRAMLIPAYIDIWGGAHNRLDMRGPVIRKYPDDDNTPFAIGNDIPVARYADVLLMLAEALNGTSGPTNEAVGYVNQVRHRAGIGDLPAADITSKEAFATAILNERAKELFFEGLRRVDLIRFGKWNEALQSVGKTPGPALLPIPQYALDESKGQLTQTPGY